MGAVDAGWCNWAGESSCGLVESIEIFQRGPESGQVSRHRDKGKC